MGKPVLSSSSWQNITIENLSSEEPRRSQRNKDLEEIRRNALAAKRKLRSKACVQRTRSKLEKTLGHFASRRREYEETLQIQNTLLLSSTRDHDDERHENHSSLPRSENSSQKQDSANKNPTSNKDKKLQKCLKTKGFFRAGIKGKELVRPLTTTERFKQAVLNEDALQVFQSGNFLRPEPKKPIEISPLTKMEISKVLKEFTDSSDSDDPVSVENLNPSPIFKSYKKKVATVKSNNNEAFNEISSRKNQFLFTKHITKEDKCKRRLFEDENTVINNVISKYSSSSSNQCENNNIIRCSHKKSTPENVIFFSEYLPTNDVSNPSKMKSCKIIPTDQKIIKYYIQTCKLLAQNDIKNTLKKVFEDSTKNAKVALRNTYTNAFKDYLNRQKLDLQSESSISEIMVEPDSAIARRLKKNNLQQIQSSEITRCGSNKNSNTLIGNNGIEQDYPNVLEISQNYHSKRKYAASSKSGHSDLEAPSSIRVNVDNDDERLSMKMDLIHPDRQELTARYLNDIEVSSQQEINRYNAFNSDNQNDITKEHSYHYEKNMIQINDNNIIKNDIVLKNTKHIPAILRKNRSFVDCPSEEKILLSMEKGSDLQEKTKKTLMRHSSTSVIVTSERTPNCSNSISNQALEAPKCKYVYMNAKYNQPPRISAPIQVRKLQRNAYVQKMQLFPTPHEVRQSYILNTNTELSPIEKQVSFSDDLNDYEMFQLSQGTSNEIQDRTNRLTLHSSQNCSQDNVDQFFIAPIDNGSSQRNLYFQACEPTSNHLSCSSKEIEQHRRSALQNCKIRFNPTEISHNDYHLQTRDSDSFQDSVLNKCQMHKSHHVKSSHQHQDPFIMCVQKPSTWQPVKFMAIERNMMPQRRPIYGMEDSNDCSHIHKSPVSSQQYSQPNNSSFQRVALEQMRYAMSSIPCQTKEVVKCENVQREPNFISNGFSESGQKFINFVPNSMSDQNFSSPRNISMNRDIHNQRYIRPVGVRIQPTASQVAYQHNNDVSNRKIFKVNDTYLQEMNHNFH